MSARTMVDEIADTAVNAPNMVEKAEVLELGIAYKKLKAETASLREKKKGERFYYWSRGVLHFFKGISLATFLGSLAVGALGGLIFGIGALTESCSGYEKDNAQGFIECKENESTSDCDCERLYLSFNNRSEECKD